MNNTRSRNRTHIHIQGLSKTYTGKNGPVDALRDIELEVRQGEIFGIIGRSGAGKSSLLRVLNRLEEPGSGKVLIGGEDIGRYDATRLRQLRRRVAMIFQHFNLMASRTVAENVALPLLMAGHSVRSQQERVEALLQLVGLADKRHATPAQLSGGQKQRVGIARALALQPEILLCDEATSALDPEATQVILALLRRINRELGLTIVLITHEMAVIRDICDRVVVLEAGRIVEQGEVWRVFGEPQHEVTRTLLHTVQPPMLDTATLACGSQQHAIMLRFNGTRAAPPDLHRLGQIFIRDFNLLQAAVEQIDGHVVGHLVASFRAAPQELASLLERAAAVADDVALLDPIKPAGTHPLVADALAA